MAGFLRCEQSALLTPPNAPNASALGAFFLELKMTSANVSDRIAPTELVKPREAAAFLGTAASTLAVWRSTNRQRLPYVKIGGLVLYRRSDLEAFIAARVVG